MHNFIKSLIILIAIFVTIFPNVSEADISTGLVGHWTFDNTANDSTGSSQGTIVGGAVWSSESKDGKGSILLDGIDDYIIIDKDLLGTGVATINVWIKPQTILSSRIFSRSVFPYTDFSMNGPNSRLSFTNDGGTTNAGSANNSLVANTWSMITLVRNSSNEVTFYINGVQSGVSNQSVGIAKTGGVANYIGTRFDHSSGFFKGNIDQLRIYNRILSPEEITQLFLYPETGGGGESPVIPSVTPSGPTTFNVRKDGSGNFRTIQEAINVMKPGDTIVVGPGRYDERIDLTVSNSGTASQPIIIKALYAASRTQITNNVSMRGWSMSGTKYITLDGFEITDIGDTAQAGIYMKFSENITIQNSYIHELNTAVNYYGGIRNSDTGGESHYITIRNNDIYRVEGRGIEANGTHWLIEGNEISHGTNCHWNEIVSQTCTTQVVNDADAMAIFGSDIVIRNNYLHDYLLAEMGPRTQSDPHVDAIMTWSNNQHVTHDVIIENNIIKNFISQAFIASNFAGTGGDVYNIIFRNNLVINIGEKGGSYALNIYDVPNVTITNNVFAILDPKYKNGWHRFRKHTIGRFGSHHLTIKNNIYYNGGMPSDIDEASMVGSVIDYNLFYPSSNFSVGVAAVQQPNSLIGDPSFIRSQSIGPDNRDFDLHLSSVSPAINRGENLSMFFTNDKDNTPRPQGSAWDIGAYEYTGTPVSTPTPAVTPTPTTSPAQPPAQKETTSSASPPLVLVAAFGPEDLQRLWNERKPAKAPVWRDMTDKRRKVAAARISEGLDSAGWLEVLDAVNASDFLSGRRSDFVANGPWCLNPENLAKIRDGNYRNTGAGPPTKGAGYRQPGATGEYDSWAELGAEVVNVG
jgi:hypothetical protein